MEVSYPVLILIEAQSNDSFLCVSRYVPAVA
jgi:hypothetical protein